MVAGHLREQNGLYQIILSYKDGDGKRKTKFISTGLPVKGNKRKAEAMLMDARQTFVPPVFAVTPLEKAKPDELLFTDFILEWLEMMKNSVETTTYASYCMVIKRKIVPYFKETRFIVADLADSSKDAATIHFAARSSTLECAALEFCMCARP